MACMIATLQKILMRSYTINYSYAEVIDKELQVMDLAAFTLARDHGMPNSCILICVNPVRYAKWYSVQKKAQRFVNLIKSK